jgi:hypothetical protein
LCRSEIECGGPKLTNASAAGITLVDPYREPGSSA